MGTCRLSDFMRPEWVIPSLKAATKEGVLEEISLYLEKQITGLDAEVLSERLLCRERKASTGADRGLAIPHATVEGVPKLMVTFARSVDGVEYGALDNERSHMFFTVLNPTHTEAGQVTYLQAISSICRLMRSSDIRGRLMKAQNAQEIYEYLIEHEVMRSSG